MSGVSPYLISFPASNWSASILSRKSSLISLFLPATEAACGTAFILHRCIAPASFHAMRRPKTFSDVIVQALEIWSVTQTTPVSAFVPPGGQSFGKVCGRAKNLQIPERPPSQVTHRARRGGGALRADRRSSAPPWSLYPPRSLVAIQSEPAEGALQQFLEKERGTLCTKERSQNAPETRR